MPTNDVRRMLADNMRCFDVVSDAGGRYWLNGTLFGMDISARSEERIRCGMNHLADLIEPNPVESDGVDRDALMALANEMEKRAAKYPIYGAVRPELQRYALCIREACGEEP